MFLKMKVAALTMDPFTNNPIVILKDLEDKRALPIWIGILEASAIATALENIKLPRPMTHDLLKNIIDSFSITVNKIEITDLKDNTFYASIHLTQNKKVIVVDARPSDSIALALRTGAPIFVNDEVIEKSKKIDLEKLETKEQDSKEKWQEMLEDLSPEDFGKNKM